MSRDRSTDFRVLVTLLAAILFVGPAAGSDNEKSPFSGSYSGKFSFKSANPRFPNGEGTVTLLTVASNGKVTGKFSPPSGEAGEFHGTVDEDGAIEYTIEFPTQTYIVKGLVVKTKKGNLKGNATQYVGKDQPAGTIEFDLPAK
jgi:hypothetical protein